MRRTIIGTGAHARYLHLIFGWPMIPIEQWVPDGFVVNGFGKRADRIAVWEKYLYSVGGVKLNGDDFDYDVGRRTSQFMQKSFVAPGVRVGVNCLVNTGAQIDHDCILGDHCVISPGAILCGGVFLGRAVRIGAGAIILQNVRLPDDFTVEAGAVVYGPDDVRGPQRHVPFL